jgi:hypothetical protein
MTIFQHIYSLQVAYETNICEAIVSHLDESLISRAFQLLRLPS